MRQQKTRCGLSAGNRCISALLFISAAPHADRSSPIDSGIGRANTDLGLFAAEAEVEQDGVAILRPHGGMVRPELGHGRAAAHRGPVARQAERHALPPAFDA